MKKIVTLLLVSIFVSETFAQSKQNIEKLGTILNIIKFAYVDSTKEDKLVEDAINGMLEQLDPHSVYIPAKDLREMNEPLEGSFEGIGIQFNILHDTITVISPIVGGPSEKLGITSGDKIIRINGVNMAGIKVKNEDVFKKLRGVKGTKVTVTCLKTGAQREEVDYTITRDKIPVYSIEASYMIDNKVGYIKLSRFAQTSHDEFIKAMTKLRKEGMQDLILDLNDNGGGYLHIADALADEFLTDGKTIVYTQGIQSPKVVNKATSKGQFEKGRLVIMVDEGSASASEIVSGAVQDWDRGLIVGRRTFGKGLVQKPFNLPDGSMVRITTARYYTPVGRCVQKNYEGAGEKYFSDLNNRYKHGELFSADSIKFPDSLKFKTPNNRVVYGGGGIMPDVFVPLDTTGGSAYALALARKNCWGLFALKYYTNERKALITKYTTGKDFANQFVCTAELMEQFFAFAESEGVKRNNEGYIKAKNLIDTRLKADIAQKMYGNDAFYEIVNTLEPIYGKAIQALQQDNFKKYKIQQQ
ncbi:MAG: S41 family peptidase [Bacteroidia bacterium]|nr:S41 family peptidase [Bacteroidia bacterium]